MPTTTALRIARIVLNVGNLERSLEFYSAALGFTVTGRSAGGAALCLGQESLQLVESPAARPYPEPCAANDPWFQHFAIAVSDMNAAYRCLGDHEPISLGGPQQLPPSTGSVIAYKFRDPDGHPLELSYIPHSRWTQASSDSVFLGIDHSGLVVADLEASIGFYIDLGFRLESRGFNTGAAQDRLDGLGGVELYIGVIKGAAGPHLELLHYRAPRSSKRRRELTTEDVASTRLVLEGVGPGARSDASGGLVHDPDHHWLQLVADGA